MNGLPKLLRFVIGQETACRSPAANDGAFASITCEVIDAATCVGETRFDGRGHSTARAGDEGVRMNTFSFVPSFSEALVAGAALAGICVGDRR